jgi:hypothetical protein
MDECNLDATTYPIHQYRRSPQVEGATQMTTHKGIGGRDGSAVAIGTTVAAITLFAAGCGGSSGAKVAQLETTTAASGSSNAVAAASSSSKPNPAAFSACMRKNGVPNFPDPDAQGRLFVRINPKGGISPTSAAFRKAQQACQKLAPNGGNRGAALGKGGEEQMLRFAACMRSHGVPKFPDPQFSADGGVTMKIGPAAGVDLSSPQFRAAQDACRRLVPGGLMMAAPGSKP